MPIESLHRLHEVARALFVIAFSAVALPAQQSQWIEQTQTLQPPYRTEHALTYDAARAEVVLFGGAGNGAVLHGDTWAWNGDAWSLRVATASPSPRRGHRLAYDSARQRVVLFGGRAGATYLADTWEWDGNDWLQRPTTSQPSPRSGHTMAYDSTRQRTVLFGGQVSGWPSINAETWEWNGATWALRSSGGPFARARAGMAFDPLRNRIVLAGGDSGTIGFDFGDTWEWDGATWFPIATSGWLPSSHLVWAWSTPFGPRIAGAVVHFPTQVRAYDGSAWGAWEPSGPSLYMAQYAYDLARDQLVAFGSNGGVPITTVLGGTPSTAVQVGAGCGSPPLQLNPMPNDGPVLGATGRARIVGSPTPVCAVTIGFTSAMFGPYGLPLPLDAFGMPGCVLRHAAEVPALPVAPVAGGLEFALAIPGQPDLLGRLLMLQAYAYAPGQNAAELIFSNRLDWRIGDV
jgi:hypothetical protein